MGQYDSKEPYVDETAGVSRQWPRSACDGCGVTTGSGEHVELWIRKDAVRRVRWAGCVGCWEKAAQLQPH